MSELDPAVRARLETLGRRLQTAGEAPAEIYVEPDDIAIALAALDAATQAADQRATLEAERDREGRDGKTVLKDSDEPTEQ